MAKIFISSTYKDLIEYRRIVAESLERMGHRVTAMEKYVATEERPLHKVLKDISECDLYIGIFAWRYGFKPEDSPNPGKSITELEYRHAAHCGRDRLCFILDENAPWPKKYKDRGIDHKNVVDLREEILKNHIIQKFKSNPEELAKLVDEAVDNWKRRIRFSSELGNKYKKYGKTYFDVVAESTDNAKKEVIHKSACYMLEKIQHLTQEYGTEIYVGIVGGPTVHDIIDSLNTTQHNNGNQDWHRLRFVSLNMAGHTTSYDFSANYLCTLLSNKFNGSKHFTALPNLNSFEKKSYKNYLTNLHILVCSAGSRNGYLNELKCYQSLSLPDNVIGDFCLWPISSNKKNVALSNSKLYSVIKELHPKPKFTQLDDIKKKYSSVSVILPLVSPRKSPNDGSTYTEKREIGDAILSSGLVTTCILNESLAEDLLKNGD